MLRVLKPGVQSTLQGAPRVGQRHLGFPYAGPADPLSMALANRLVGNAPDTTCIEITFGDFEAEVLKPCSVAITGAVGKISVSGREVTFHKSLLVKAGDWIAITPPEKGVRSYLAINSGFRADKYLDSTSTYLPAGLGGHKGREVEAGDVLKPCGRAQFSKILETPIGLRPVISRSIALRTCPSSETSLLSEADGKAFFETNFTVGQQVSRMGITLNGPSIIPRSNGNLKSAPVFPGTVQCPPSGNPIALLCDAQTTGGYPRIAVIARCDRHQLGQARPGDRIRLLKRTPEEATSDYLAKRSLLATWLESQ